MWSEGVEKTGDGKRNSKCQDPRDNPGSPSEGMRLRRGELDRVPFMNCLAIYISTHGYAKTILREIFGIY